MGQQRLVLFRRQKRKPQANPSRDTVQKATPGSERSAESSPQPLPIRKWQEYKKFVNSGKARRTEICSLQLGEGRSEVGGSARCWVSLFSGDGCIPSRSHSISFRAEWTPSKPEEAGEDRVSSGKALQHPSITHSLCTPLPPTVFRVPLGCPYSKRTMLIVGECYLRRWQSK